MRMIEVLAIYHEWRKAVWYARHAAAELGFKLFHRGPTAWRCAMQMETARVMGDYHRRVHRRLTDMLRATAVKIPDGSKVNDDGLRWP